MQKNSPALVVFSGNDEGKDEVVVLKDKKIDMSGFRAIMSMTEEEQKQYLKHINSGEWSKAATVVSSSKKDKKVPKWAYVLSRSEVTVDVSLPKEERHIKL